MSLNSNEVNNNLIERYKAGIIWLKKRWNTPSYVKGLRRLEEIEDSLRDRGYTVAELENINRQVEGLK